ncbi:putative repeat protein (TIGR02543 family), partial [Microbacterium sp. AG790]|uniref:InlB B-repeat-containing protein n=1 Tax=Microbacterium sp. AG790 TaxID=2183995 RepID=UPI000F2145EE
MTTQPTVPAQTMKRAIAAILAAIIAGTLLVFTPQSASAEVALSSTVSATTTAGQWLYVAYEVGGYSGLAVLDNSDPSHPVQVALLPRGATTVGEGGFTKEQGVVQVLRARGGYVYALSDEYVGYGKAKWLTVIDVRDPYHPRVVSALRDADTGSTAGNLFLKGDFLIMTSAGATMSRLRMVSIQNPASPVVVSTYTGDATSGTSPSVAFYGETVYFAKLLAAADPKTNKRPFRVESVDVSNPNAPFRSGMFDGKDRDDERNVVSIVAKDGYLYLGDTWAIRTYDLRDPANPHRSSVTTLPEEYGTINLQEFRGNYLVGVGSGDPITRNHWFLTWDLSDPGSPRAAGHASTSAGTARGASVSEDGYAYELYGNGDYSHVRLIDAREPSDPKLVREFVVPAEASVSFNPNGGGGQMDEQTSLFPGQLERNKFTRAGYTFTGWNTAADGSGTGFADRAEYGFSSSVTLFAQWKRVEYTVTFDANGGAGSMAAQVGYEPTSLTANVFARAGYRFAGWNTAADGSGTSYADRAQFPFSSSGTLYAQWSAEHTVTFDANGGVGSMSGQVEAFPAPLSANVFTREGYEFTGWNTAADGRGTAYADRAQFRFSSSVTLFAQWKRVEYTVTFDANGGAGSMAAQVGYEPTSLTANVFARAGYRFAGWNTAADGSGTSYADRAQFPFSSSGTLYAQWSAEHTVTFDANGGIGSMSGQVEAFPAPLSANVFTREGYEFTGWNTAADGSGTGFADRAEYG